MNVLYDCITLVVLRLIWARGYPPGVSRKLSMMVNTLFMFTKSNKNTQRGKNLVTIALQQTKVLISTYGTKMYYTIYLINTFS